MDIKAKKEEILEKVKGDNGFLAKFKENPVKAIEEYTGKDLPDEQIKEIAAGIKSKIVLDKDGDGKIDVLENIGDKVGELGEKLGGLFKKE